MLRSPIRCNWLSFCCAERVSETHRRSTPMSWPIHGILSADTVCSIGQYLLILSGSVYLTWVGYILCTRYGIIIHAQFRFIDSGALITTTWGRSAISFVQKFSATYMASEFIPSHTACTVDPIESRHHLPSY